MRALGLRNEDRDYYIEGNAARKLNTAPKKADRPKEKKKQVDQRISQNAKRAKAFDLKYTVALVAATLFLFGACISMLTSQAELTEQRREIAALESNLNALKDSNDEMSKRLESSVDLTKVYDVAVKELGMVYPKNGQVVSYEASNPDYVKQFKDVPEK